MIERNVLCECNKRYELPDDGPDWGLLAGGYASVAFILAVLFLVSLCCNAVHGGTLQERVDEIKTMRSVAKALRYMEAERQPRFFLNESYVTNQVAVEEFYYLFDEDWELFSVIGVSDEEQGIHKWKPPLPRLPTIRHLVYRWDVVNGGNSGIQTEVEFYVVFHKTDYVVDWFGEVDHMMVEYHVDRKFKRCISDFYGIKDTWEIPVWTRGEK